MQQFKPSPHRERDYRQIDRALQGDQQSYQALWQQYHRHLYFRILKMVQVREDAQDLTAEVFAKAFTNLHRFRKEHAFSTWLFRIATNHTLDFIRRKKMEALCFYSAAPCEDETGMLSQLAGPLPGPEELLQSVQRAEQVGRIINTLPKQYRKVITLRYYDQLSYAEIAQRTEASMGTVKSYLHRAHQLLRESLASHRGSFFNH